MANIFVALRENLINNENVSEIYKAMEGEDLSEIVLKAMKLLNLENTLPSVVKKMKSERESEKHRLMGNDSLSRGEYQNAFMLYNAAILHAPNNSRAMKLALGNRSALLFRVQAYRACLKDIETCFRMGCPADIKEKLNKRKEEATNSVHIEDFRYNMSNRLAESCLNANFSRNPQIPCVSQDVEIIGSVTPKVVAANKIQAGTVISCEKAYISCVDNSNALFMCEYCLKMSLNLLPCETCCTVLFCSEECKDRCYEEYHKYECKIIDNIKDKFVSYLDILMMKTVFKIKSNLKSWKEIIKASKKLGLERMKSSTSREIFDSGYIFSCLNARDDKPFVHGNLFNCSIICSVCLHYFEKIPSFYPQNKVEKQQAIQALARIMLFLCAYQTITFVNHTVINVIDNKSHAFHQPSACIFSFTGKLKNSCTPNLFVINKNNELMLIAIQTIEKGEELTLCMPIHLLDSDISGRVRNISRFSLWGYVCDCSMCAGDTTGLQQLSEIQKNYYRSLDFSRFDNVFNDLSKISEVFYKILKAFDVLKNVPRSNEYKEVYKRFKRCIIFYEVTKSDNYSFYDPFLAS